MLRKVLTLTLCIILYYSTSNAINIPIKRNGIVGAVTYSVGNINNGYHWMQFPVINLNGSNSLRLSFDLLESEPRQLIYSIYKREYNWYNTKLQSSQYIDGFNQVNIEMGVPSVATLVNYCHYSTTINTKNNTLGIAMSGNYIISFYDVNNEGEPIFEFPFAIIDNMSEVYTSMASQPNNGDFTSYQGVNVNLKIYGSNLYNPQEYLKVVVLQNGRWDNANILTSPSLIRSNEIGYQGEASATFEAGNQFYKIEHTSDRSASIGVDHIYLQDNIYQLDLFGNKSRVNLPYIYEQDQYGRQVISKKSDIDITNNSDINADYQMIHFTFISANIKDGEIYLSGEAFRFMPNRYKRLSYDYNNNCYKLDVLLKMGYQEYKYLLKKFNTNTLVSKYTCGNHFQTTNEYTILVYKYNLQYNTYDLIGYKSFVTSVI